MQQSTGCSGTVPSIQQRFAEEQVQSFRPWVHNRCNNCLLYRREITDLPKQGHVCVFSDGSNAMKSVKNELQKHVALSLVDSGNCILHNFHDALGKGLDTIGLDVEEVVRNVTTLKVLSRLKH